MIIPVGKCNCREELPASQEGDQTWKLLLSPDFFLTLAGKIPL